MLWRSRKRIAAVGLMLALAGSGAMVGELGSAAASAASAANVPLPAAGPTGLDHFLCYSASTLPGQNFVIPPKVKLKNQFSTKAFLATFGPVVQHCNPALKVVSTATGTQSFPPQSPSWHLLCFAIRGNQVPSTHLVQVTDQFGQGRLKTGPPQHFCLPSLKSTQTPPVFNPPGPNEIMPDHFTCYPVTLKSGSFTPPGAVLVGDQFNNFQPVTVQVGAPNSLCLPTKKIVFSSSGTKTVTKVTNSVAHLLCFDVVSPESFTGTVWDQNQFGVGGMNIQQPLGLCVPSFKTLIH